MTALPGSLNEWLTQFALALVLSRDVRKTAIELLRTERILIVFSQQFLDVTSLGLAHDWLRGRSLSCDRSGGRRLLSRN